MSPSSPRSTSTLMRRLAMLGVAALGMSLAACAGENPLAPTASPVGPTAGAVFQKGELLSIVTSANSLKWRDRVSEQEVHADIGPNGGTLVMRDGVTMIVPPGAVDRKIRFSITRLAGRAVAYDFQPHGTQFHVPVQIEQSLDRVDLSGVSLLSVVRGAYIPDETTLDQDNGTALVSEFRPTLLSFLKNSVSFTVDHFSGYMISMD